MNRKLAKVFVTHELIRDALHFPDNAKILHILTIDPLKSQICIECEDFPEVKEGEIIPEISPVLEKRESIILKDWGFIKANK